MNTKPDFTKAPEGATHYAIDGLGYTVWFRDIVEGESYKVCGKFCPGWISGKGCPVLKYDLIPQEGQVEKEEMLAKLEKDFESTLNKFDMSIPECAEYLYNKGWRKMEDK